MLMGSRTSLPYLGILEDVSGLPFLGNSQNIFQQLRVCSTAVMIFWLELHVWICWFCYWADGKANVGLLCGNPGEKVEYGNVNSWDSSQRDPNCHCFRTCFRYIFESSQCYRFGWLVELWSPNCLEWLNLFLTWKMHWKRQTRFLKAVILLWVMNPMPFFPALPFLFSWNVWDIWKKSMSPVIRLYFSVTHTIHALSK